MSVCTRLVAVALLTIATTFVTKIALADDAPPEAFYGHYIGTGMDQNPNVTYFGFMARDMDVKIGPEGDGFFVEWTTVFRRESGEEGPKRKSSRVAFVPSTRPGIFLEVAAGERIANGLTWAAISGRTLTVRALAIEDDGTYAIQTYRRALTDKGLFLQFVSDQDGQTIRMVSGRLTKQGE